MADITFAPVTTSPIPANIRVSLDVDYILIEANAHALHLLCQHSEPETLATFADMWRRADDLDRLVICQGVIRALESL